MDVVAAASRKHQLSNGVDVDHAEEPRPAKRLHSTASYGESGASTPSEQSAVKRMDLWVYSPNDLLPDLTKHVGWEIDVKIEAKYLMSTNEKITTGQLWGTDVYTDDSDVVAILVHTNHFVPTTVQPEKDLLVTLRVAALQPTYTTSIRYGLESRTWTGHDACSIEFLRMRWIAPNSSVPAVPLPKPLELLDDGKDLDAESRFEALRRERQARKPLHRSSRSQDSNSRYGEVLPNVSVSFGFSNEPCLKYTMNMVADRGTCSSAFTSYRLKTEVLYLETTTNRYELSRVPTNGSPFRSNSSSSSNTPVNFAEQSIFDRYRWADVSTPKKCSSRSEMLSCTLPFSEADLNVIATDLDWAELVWSRQSLRIRGNTYDLKRMFWMPVTPPSTPIEC